MRNRNARIVGEVAILLLLAGAFSQLRSSRATTPEQPTWDTEYRSYIGSPTMAVSATVRTFASGASPDFPRTSLTGPGRYANILAENLDASGSPTFRSTGQRVLTSSLDAAGNIISPPRPYITSAPGDVRGTLDSTAGGAVSSESSFSLWFADARGVNTSAKSPITFNYESGKYVFDGSLDRLNGGTNPNYTAELTFPFVYETGRNYYFTAETGAEVWVYINGQLVIDGGGMPAPAFTITNGAVVPGEPVQATMTVVGSAIQSGSTPLPVTTRASAGSTHEPFGSYSDPARGNVNDGSNPRNATLSGTIAAGTPISVSGTSWMRDSRGRYSKYLEAHSSPATAQVKVLRDGDPVPNITPFANQTSITTYLQPYLNTQTRKVTLQPHQTIFLFELGTTNISSSAADFQDLVVLVNLARAGTPGSSGSTSSGSGSGLSSQAQRIDLSRLSGLDDRGSYTIKVLFANRTGAASNLRLETNIATLNLANRPVWPGHD